MTTDPTTRGKSRPDNDDLSDDCISCGEEATHEECRGSLRSCGHHCNHSWSHDSCCWCGQEWDGDSING